MAPSLVVDSPYETLTLLQDLSDAIDGRTWSAESEADVRAHMISACAWNCGVQLLYM